MANWEVDPRPFVPEGWVLADNPVPNPLLRHEVFVTGCYTLKNENLAIVLLQPRVHKDDFADLSVALRAYFEQMHQVRVDEILPCPLGDAFVRFGSALDRERFLGPVFGFGDYTMSLCKHDDGGNARTFNLDREVWVLLLAYPEDLKCGVSVAKAVSGFGILVYWHETESAGAIVAKVYLNDSAKIPSSVKVNAGLPEMGRSWTAACFVLKLKNTGMPRGEEGFVTMGPLHPVPPPAPRWNGPHLSDSTNSTPSDNARSGGLADNADGSRGRWMQQNTPRDDNLIIQLDESTDDGTPSVNLSSNVQNKGKLPMVLEKFPVFSPKFKPQTLKSIIIGPSEVAGAKEPLIPVIPSLIRQLGDGAMEKLALEGMLFEDNAAKDAELVEDTDPVVDNTMAAAVDEDVEMEILETAPPIFATPTKKKHVIVREQLEDSFCRRSRRLSEKRQGYKNKESAKKAEEPKDVGSSKMKKKAQKTLFGEEIIAPVPLAMIPPGSSNVISPHVPPSILGAISRDFLQIQPESASAAIFKEDNIDD